MRTRQDGPTPGALRRDSRALVQRAALVDRTNVARFARRAGPCGYSRCRAGRHDGAMADPRAGQPAQPQDLVDLPHLVTAYYTQVPDPDVVEQQVVFGTSGHRGSSLDTAFNEWHILATTQAICDYRKQQGYDGPLFIGRDTHGLSEPAWVTALEVLAANDVTVLVDSRDALHADPGGLARDPARQQGQVADRVRAGRRDRRHAVAQPAQRRRLQVQPAARRARRHRRDRGDRRPRQRADQGRAGRRAPYAVREGARRRELLRLHGHLRRRPAVRRRPRRRSSRPASGSAPTRSAARRCDYWAEIANRHGLDLTVVNPLVDATWRFMTLDWDGKIRMDCSSPSAMASLVAQKDKFQIATGNDADSDRHGIVTPDAGLMNPNHYLAVAIQYLFGGGRPGWPSGGADRQDPGVELDDRPGRGRARQADGRGAGRVQVVRAGADRRLVRLRRRGVRRRVVPAHGRDDVDHRQGRAHPRPARLGDPREDRPDPEPALRRAGRAARRPGVRPHRRARDPRAEGQAGRPLPRRRDRHRAGRRADHRQAHRGARQPRRRSAGSRSPPSRRGSRPARPAPRTSTRSTPSRSRVPSTSPRCRPRPRRSWTPRSAG